MTEHRIDWNAGRIRVELSAGPDRPVGVHRIRTDGFDLVSGSDAPVVEVLTAGQGRARSTSRLSETLVGARMRYLSHQVTLDGSANVLTVHQKDYESGLRTALQLRSEENSASLTARVTVINDGAARSLILAMPSLVLELRFGAQDSSFAPDTSLSHGRSDWLAESRWTSTPLRSALVDWSRGAHGSNGRGQISVISSGSWTTGRNLPVAAIESVRASTALIWQIDHSGPWRWELAENDTGLSLALSGPTDLDHAFSRLLEPGAAFTSPTATIAIGPTLDSALAELTIARRSRRRSHPDDEAPSVVYNDFMNTLMGDPSTEAILPLVDASAAIGAEVYCIDAGWYDDGDDWWDKVGQWKPSTRRFPQGIEEVTDAITSTGMRAGLWFEPEVVGVNSPAANTLPPDAFFSRSGIPVREHGRFHLDFSSAAARDHVSSAIERLIDQLKLGYLKLDYNIDAGAGSDLATASVGEGLLNHTTGYLAWLDEMRGRHPNVIIENCASGAMRADAPLLDRVQVQSTSDQQDPRRYPPISASAPMSMLPEQAASWAYPQPDMTDEEIAFTCCTSMLGRMYLSGRIDLMTPAQLRIVGQAVTAHKAIRDRIRSSAPIWPIGLPDWNDEWIALGLMDREKSSALLTIWKRASKEARIILPFPQFHGHVLSVTAVFPATGTWRADWHQDAGVLSITSDKNVPFAARTLLLEVQEPSAPRSDV
ncbi:hypothetical protein GCM10027404_22050 [Arthrobacter tumbae]|uniref:glycoside hydrolase family 36 protein n=1 Tax=Arthrobacter tumbae TaxID=163874 RepID=UPI00195B1418|nr:glycoside hydrolase family 36 protein [Arthrobacter tumbae]MBM7781890.1 alpha-galactosidase [Arthrobacter tumbae]